MQFSLNTKSGMLHKEGHGGEASSTGFERADEADVFAHRNGMKMKFCSVCFKDEPEATVETPATSPSQFTTAAGTTPPTLTVTDEV